MTRFPFASSSPRSGSSLALASVLALVGPAVACGDDDDTGTATGATSSDTDDASTTGTPTSTGTTAPTGTTDPTTDAPTTSSGTTGTTTGTDTDATTGTATDTTGTETDGDDKPALGETTNILCDAAIAELVKIQAERAKALDGDAGTTADLAAASIAYEGTALQEAVQRFGGELGRVTDGLLDDDAAILASLAEGTEAGLIAAEFRIHTLFSQLIRTRTNDISVAPPDMATPVGLRYAAWDEAYCYWVGALRPFAEEADALGLVPGEDAAVTDIEFGFEYGHSGIESEAASFAIDDFVVPPGKQVLEKSMFRVQTKLVIDWAERAATANDPLAAQVADGHFQLIEDRLEGRNTPGITIIEDALAGDPMAIDVDVIEREIAIAFFKRVRTYTDQALGGEAIRTKDNVKGAWEGWTYVKLVLPAMVRDLPGFDGAAHMQAWLDYRNAVEADDRATAEARSTVLTQANCDYQTTVLGLAACTSNTDETP
jgi:hypothetical protein